MDKDLQELFGERIYDQNAKTTIEVAAEVGLSDQQAYHVLKTAVSAGTWERVYKKAADGRTVPAYRKKPQNNA